MRWRLSKVGLTRTALLAGAFVVLEALCRFGVIDPLTMIPPTAMVAALWQILVSGKYDADIFFTISNIVLAFLLAITAGFVIGAFLHAVPRLRRTVEPLLSAYYAVPTFVFYPLLIVFFGVGRTALVVIGALFGIVAMIINTLLGLDHVPAVIARTAAILRLDSWRRMFLLRLPSATPHLVTGIKLAVAYSVIGVVAGEFILATEGIGKRIAYAYDNFDNRTMYGLLLFLLVVVMVINGSLSIWEKRLHQRFGQR
jgi:NitT/TauT family transport system permease protein